MDRNVDRLLLFVFERVQLVLDGVSISHIAKPGPFRYQDETIWDRFDGEAIAGRLESN